MFRFSDVVNGIKGISQKKYFDFLARWELNDLHFNGRLKGTYGYVYVQVVKKNVVRPTIKCIHTHTHYVYVQ